MNSRVLAQTKPKPTLAPPVRSNLLQRKCACGGNAGFDGECEECRKRKLQRKALNSETSTQPSTFNSQPSEVPPIVHEVLRSPGQPLDPETREFIEPRLGHDFSHVRVHTDSRAAESARAVNALAYAVGRDVVFGADRYAPATSEGRKLIAHELIHVAQQLNNAIQPGRLSIGPAGDAYETEADSLASQAVKDGSAIVRKPMPCGTRLHRACGPAEIGSQAGCVGRGGDITDFGGDSGKIFGFRVSCDEFLPGEKARVQDLASTLSPDDHLQVDGFASEEGSPQFNEDLSCARAKALASALMQAGLSSSQFDGVYMHGATSGGRADRRSAVVTIRLASAPQPEPAPSAELKSEKVVVWINAFIPRDVPGLTKLVPKGSYAGQTMIPGPPFFDCFLTDNRDFSSASDATQRMRQGLVIDVNSLTVTNHLFYSDPTHQIDCDDGHVVCESMASPEIAYDVVERTPNTLKVKISGAGSNPCVRLSPNIDYDGTLLLSKKNGELWLAFMGRVDEFPAFEMYALSTTVGQPQEIFRSMPPKGNTPWDLKGPPPLPRKGFASFH